MQSNVRVITAKTRQRGRHDPKKRRQRFAAKAGKAQIEPDHVGLNLANGFEQTAWSSEAIEAPAAYYPEPFQLGILRGEFIPENGEVQSRNGLQLASDMETVLVQSIAARRKRRDQANVHCCPGLKSESRDSLPKREKYWMATRKSALLLPKWRAAN